MSAHTRPTRHVIRGRWLLAAIVAALQSVSGDTAHAQAACTLTPANAGSAADVCQKAQDIFSFVVPQIGVALVGGNPVLGEGGTLGGWGKVWFGIRATVVDGQLPTNNVPLTLGRPNAVGDNFGAKRTVVPMPSIDAAVGLWSGVPAGLTNVGGVDLLLGVNAVPSLTEDEFSVNPSTRSYAFSYGVRVGALQESSLIPGVSVSWQRRRIPNLNVALTSSNDTLNVRDAALTSTALRLVASKRFAFFGIAAGVGRDKIDGSTSINAVVNETVQNVPVRSTVTISELNESVSRNSAFVNASFGVAVARIVAEVGRSSAGSTKQTLNTFGDRRANEGYTYGSFGFTFRF